LFYKTPARWVFKVGLLPGIRTNIFIFHSSRKLCNREFTSLIIQNLTDALFIMMLKSTRLILLPLQL
jgi:hypothetical protein